MFSIFIDDCFQEIEFQIYIYIYIKRKKETKSLILEEANIFSKRIKYVLLQIVAKFLNQKKLWWGKKRNPNIATRLSWKKTTSYKNLQRKTHWIKLNVEFQMTRFFNLRNWSKAIKWRIDESPVLHARNQHCYGRRSGARFNR